MIITRIFAHRVELPLSEASYHWSGGKSVSVFDSTRPKVILAFSSRWVAILIKTLNAFIMSDLATDVVNLKISNLGGLTKTKKVRDLCVSMGIALTLEDSWGGDITAATIDHHGYNRSFGA